MSKRLVYRDPRGQGGKGYAEWLQRLGKASGVYVIRDRRSREVLYIGESHTGHLYSTITRHFQYWEGFTAGVVVDRDKVEVAVRTTPPRAAFAHQVKLIKKLRPKRNKNHTPNGHVDARDSDEWRQFVD